MKSRADLGIDTKTTVVIEKAGQTPAKGSLLVAEDNPANQLLAVMNLEKLGYVVQVVSNGQEVLEITKQRRFDLILMDCQMPLLDGYDATRALREREARLGSVRTPVVAMTANALGGDREQCLAAGMDDYLPKPVKRDVLKGVLEKWLPPSSSPANVAAGATSHASKAEPLDVSLTSFDPGVLDALARDSSVDAVKAFIAIVVSDAKTGLCELRLAAVRSDAETCRAIAHRFKSSFGSAGLPGFGASLGAIESSAATAPAGTTGWPEAAHAASRAEALESALPLVSASLLSWNGPTRPKNPS